MIIAGVGENSIDPLDPLRYLQQRRGENWLVGCDRVKFDRDVRDIYQQIQQFFSDLSTAEEVIRIIIVRNNSIDFLAAFLAAISSHCAVFLADPAWVDREWQEVLKLVQPQVIIGDEIVCLKNEVKRERLAAGSIAIPTGGSSGKIKFALHNWQTLTNSARGFYNYFDRQSVNSCCILPVYHVGGLMQFIRSFITGGKFCNLPYKDLKNNVDRLQFITAELDLSPEDFYISLVPTQLKFILDNNSEWLSRFQTVFVGGAAIWEDLLLTAKQHRINLAPTYGMTETAAQIATLKPKDFLDREIKDSQNNYSCGNILPHIKLTIRNEAGEILEKRRSGIICIEGKSLFLGYYSPNTIATINRVETFLTDDIGYLDDRNQLYIIGRNSRKIITGGKNVFPAEIEAAILATGLVADVCVLGLSDSYWGQVIVAVCVAENSENFAKIQIVAREILSNYKKPKYWLRVDSLNRNDRGKIDYDRIKRLATREIESLLNP